jgi:hypothetical protein
MHDPEFEKHVQKKLEELQFNPSGEVWTKVEQEIKKEKRRKPLLWIFLLSGLLLGAGYWMLVAGSKEEVKSKKEKAKTESADNNINALTNKNSVSEQKNLKEDDQPKVNANKENDVSINNRSIAKNDITIKPKTSSSQKKSLDDKQSVPFLSKNEKGESKNLKVKKEADDDIVANEIKTKKENVATDSQISKESVDNEIKTKKEDLSNKENVTADSQINKTVVAKNVNSKKSKSLRLGFTGGAGFSDINKMASNYNLPASVPLGGAGYGANATPSSIQKGVSFYAGAFLERSFSKKISISAGINYHYYSTKILTGKTVDSIIYVPVYNYTASSNPVPSSIPRPAYYASGATNSYINQYHFLELPVIMNFQLNNNKKLPLTWQAGLSFSYLINTNALQFDPSSGAYYKDNSFFNKTQINLLTGFVIGFYSKKSLIEIGPEIQYGATNLLHGYTNNNQHIFYGGLKLSVALSKKN